MAKRFFDLNPFRRKKRQLWKKGGAETPAEEEQEAPAAADVEFADASEELPAASQAPESDVLEPVDTFEGFGGPEDTPVDLTPPEAIGSAAPADVEFTFDEPAVAVPAPAPAPAPARAPAPRAPAPPADEPPRVELPADTGVAGEGGGEMRSVRDSVESLRRRAMTAGQLRETIERTIEARLAGIKDVIARVQALFDEGADKLRAIGEGGGAGGVAVDRAVSALVPQVADAVSNVVTERMTDLAQTLHNLGQGLSADLSGRLHAVGEQSAGLRALVTELRSAGRQDADALKAQLAELSNRLPKAVDEAAIAAQLRSQEERLVAWLERLNVAAERETRRADEQHDEVKNLLGTLARDQAMVSQVRSQLNRVRGNLSAGLADVKEEMLRSFLARSFLSTRLETALEPAQAALTELDAVLKRLAEL